MQPSGTAVASKELSKKYVLIKCEFCKSPVVRL